MLALSCISDVLLCTIASTLTGGSFNGIPLVLVAVESGGVLPTSRPSVDDIIATMKRKGHRREMMVIIVFFGCGKVALSNKQEGSSVY